MSAPITFSTRAECHITYTRTQRASFNTERLRDKMARNGLARSMSDDQTRSELSEMLLLIDDYF
jgi:hypothetical protein